MLAEIADKMWSIKTLYGISAVLFVVLGGFGFLGRGGAFFGFGMGALFAFIMMDSGDFADAIVRELGEGYLWHERASALIPLAGPAIGYLIHRRFERNSRHRPN